MLRCSLILLLAAHGVLAQKTSPICTSVESFAGLTTSYSDGIVTKELLSFNSVSLGRDGEGSGELLDHCRNFIAYFDTTYNTSELVEIIRHNDCPVVCSYAFLALVAEREPVVTNELITSLIRRFASDTVNTLNVHWGCGYWEIPVFDYMMCTMTKWVNKTLLPYLEPLDNESVENLLAVRKPFHNERMFHYPHPIWEDYRTNLLKGLNFK